MPDMLRHPGAGHCCKACVHAKPAMFRHLGKVRCAILRPDKSTARWETAGLVDRSGPACPKFKPKSKRRGCLAPGLWPRPRSEGAPDG